MLSSIHLSTQQRNTRAPQADPIKPTDMDGFIAPDDDDDQEVFSFIFSQGVDQTTVTHEGGQ